MTEKIKNEEMITDETTEVVDLQKKAGLFALDEKVDDFKETAEKAASAVGDAAKEVSDYAGKQLDTAKAVFGKVGDDFDDYLKRQRFEKYKPLFMGNLEDGSLTYPEMVQLVDTDKRLEYEGFQDAIGYQRTIQKQDLLEIYKKDLDKFGLSFYPDQSLAIYYVHPLDSNMYINIKDYFKYLKEARVAELEQIAQALGAKHFRVSIMEESNATSIKKDKGSAKLAILKDKIDANVDIEESEKEYQFVGIAAESRFPGKAPTEPVLKFWKNNIAINTLVRQRLSEDNPLTSKTYHLDYNTSTGIREKEAAKIDGVLKSLKFNGAGSITQEVKTENKKRFEFVIEF